MKNKRNPIKTSMLLMLFPLFLIPSTSLAINIEGRVFDEKGPMADAKVYVYKSYEDIAANRPFKVSGPTDKKGLYRLQLPGGDYYFTSLGKKDGKEFYSYHGNNPVKIEKENAWITMLANEVKPPVYSDGATSVRGVVTYKGKPVKDAYISFYTPETKRFRGLGFRTDSVDDDGTFNISLPPNKYVIIAKKLEGDNRVRPLRGGDLFCYYPGNPVEVKTNSMVQVEIPCYPKNGRNSFVNAPMIKSNDYLTVQESTDKYKFGIKGKVVDIDGRPMEGVYVLAYRGEYDTVFMMFHVSHGTEYAGKTDKDGNYFIPIDADGNYRILARNTLGGSPHSGDVYGMYGGNPSHIVSFKKGEIVENIDITVGNAMTEELKYKVKDSVTIDGVVYKNDVIIDRDTVWKGNILVHGTVWVKRGVTLIIEPGTVVRFKKVDRDKNGIGDGEIIIEGRIIARGTRKDRIVFTSAEDKPEEKDWSYILFLATGSDNIFEHCDFRYAFSGLQIHYSKATVTDCLFENNNEGIRFNRSNVVIEHNEFRDNDIGLRMVRLEGKAVVRDNLITRNNTGIMFAQPHGKTVNFYLEPPASQLDMPLIANNNIYNNIDYNYKTGERKSIAVEIMRNWWGDVKKEAIEELIYDKRADSNLAEAIYFPFLNEPVKDAGIRGKGRSM